MMAPDSASVRSPSTITGDLPSGWIFSAPRRQHSLRIAFVALHLIGHAQLFQKPQNALRPRVIEMMNNDQEAPVRCHTSSPTRTPLPSCKGTARNVSRSPLKA